MGRADSSNNPAQLEESDLGITRRLKAIFDAGHLTQEELAKELDLTQPHISRLLLGKTAWKKKYIELFSKIYKISLHKILIAQEVPMIACIINDEGFDYNLITVGRCEMMAPAPPCEENLDDLYCLKVEGDFFRPLLRDGSLLYCRKGGELQVEDDQLVVYVDSLGTASLRQIKFDSDNFIILKSPSLLGNYLVVSKTNLRMVDKVEWLKL
ncbi:MAG: helix-turn-helix domain-containing protein [Deltaproteobacteria bacterium]|nr:helix-turn-helix domain-containing protein [Deltaproteobacteria bacterium]